MSKKVILFIGILFFIVGCSNNVGNTNDNSNSTQEIIYTKEINCSLDDSNFVLELQNGQIVKYIDEIDGDLGQETVDILNSEHLVGVSDNDTALTIMDAALKDLGGFCK